VTDPGPPPYPPPPMPYAGAGSATGPPRNGLGTAALVLAIIGLLVCWIPFVGVLAIVLGVVAVALGFVGRGRVSRGLATNGGVAVAGIVLGLLSIVAGAVFIVIWVFAAREVGVVDLYDCINKAGSDQAAQEKCAEQFTENIETRFSMTLTTGP
jgi:hypothetical protein